MFTNDQIPSDQQYLQIFHMKILPTIRQYNPTLILVSAGFDAVQREAEQCAQVSPEGFFQMTKLLKSLQIPFRIRFGRWISTRISGKIC